MDIFYRDEMVADGESYSLSPLKPKYFVAQAAKVDSVRVRSFEPATRAQISLAHNADYVDGVLDCALPNGFGKKSHKVARSPPFTVGSMIAATRAALESAKEGTGAASTCSPTSGFHHAGYDYGGGFCTFNGLIVAAMVARQDKLCERVYIIDGDQHWGDGTQDIIDRRGLEWIRQFHGPRSNSTAYFKALDVCMKEARGADLIIYQAGADIHVKDPLGGVLTTREMRERDERLLELADTTPFVWNLAGGYQLDPGGRTKEEELAPVLALHLQTLKTFAEVADRAELSDVAVDATNLQH